jgi:hypothetical protein
VNPHLTYQVTIAQIDELRRMAANQQLTREAARSKYQPRLRRSRLPRLGFTLRTRERVA